MLNARWNNVRVETKRQNVRLDRQLKDTFLVVLSLYWAFTMTLFKQTTFVCDFICSFNCPSSLLFRIDAENLNQNSHLNFHPESDLEL